MHKIFFLLLLIPYSILLSAQNALTLERVREMALEHNHKVRDAQLTTQIAEQAVRQYRANYLPNISLTGLAAYGTSSNTMFALPLSGLGKIMGLPVPLRDISVDWEMGWIYNGGITLKQPIFMGGKIVAANRIARHSVAMAKQNQRMTDTEVIEQADNAFVNVVRACELKVVAEKYMELLTELERNVQSAVNLGLKMPADILRVQVKKNEVELQMHRAENGLCLAKMNLNYVTGRPLGSDIAVEKSIKTDISMTVVEGERPEAAILREQLEIARQQVRVVRAEMLPSIALIANYGYTKGITVASSKLMNGADFIGGVTLNIPIYHFGERQAKLRQAKLRAEQAQNKLDDINEQLHMALVKAHNEADEAVIEAELSERSLQQAETSLEMTRHQYDNGMATLSDLLEAQALWQKAYEISVEAHCNLHIANTSLAKAMGTLRL